jgi:hypothetical protein
MSEAYRHFTGGLSLVRRMAGPVWYRYRAGLGLPTTPTIGWLAQEMERGFPVAVSTGWRSPEGGVPDDTRAINYIPVIAVLFNAVRQLDRIVCALGVAVLVLLWWTRGRAREELPGAD